MRIESARLHGPYGDHGYVLEVRGAEGERGFGECAPLRGYSRETLEQAAAELADWHTPPRTPSARFALETATLDARARAHGVPLSTLLGARIDARIERNALVSLASPALEDDATALVNAGYRTLKAKLRAPQWREDWAAAKRLRRAVGEDVALRFDANGACDASTARDVLNAFGELHAEYIEEPCRGEALASLGAAATPWAADESLAEAWANGEIALATALVNAPGCGAVVIKPAHVGLFAALELAQIAREAGRGVVITHMQDGPLGLAAACELALALAGATGMRACGLDPHAALAAWPATHVPQLVTPATVTPARLGHGVIWSAA